MEPNPQQPQRTGATAGPSGAAAFLSTPRARRALAMAAAVAVLSGSAITAGLWWGKDGPALGAGPDDAVTTAPECSVVEAGTVAELLPSGRPEADEHGPLMDAEGTTCVWTSVDADGVPPRVLAVDFEARFTDRAGDVTGASAAARALQGFAPVADLEGAAPLPRLGADALVWPGADDGTAELVFRSDNLLVRVSYGGAEDSGGAPLSFAAARDGAVAVAEQVADAL
ncbi:hypothetical protein HNR23_002850 [Nocardiopsis mwathae]|uniref:DUF3558 domain-containing protein n=1 Tax=Nocardiopsis mwathae TaxID=1472723 RepID=A0A7X0D615_9ACTN|nr:hypothetical protein [Nocardiopsis mwathae]MBB6172790.1 hypothetical protein [Nocardiopsis mwathae]